MYGTLIIRTLKGTLIETTTPIGVLQGSGLLGLRS